jgi:hypothetical protein
MEYGITDQVIQQLQNGINNIKGKYKKKKRE